MWTYIKKSQADLYFEKYNQLNDNREYLELLDTEDAYFLPRLFYKNYPSEHLTIFTGKQDQYKPEEINNIEFKGELREEQIPIVNKIINTYNDNGFVNGIIKARPGLGKTVLAVYAATKLKIKTLIVVDNQNLMKQWIKAFLTFTNLTEDDIGIIQQKYFGIDRPVVIAMAQTLVSKLKNGIKDAFTAVDKGKIGLVVYDEVHATSSAPIFSKISLLFRTKNIIGLSATPFQTGFAEILMKNTIGEIIYETKVYDLKPEYRIINYHSHLDSKKVYVIKILDDYIKKKAMYNKLIASNENYKNIILEQTKRARRDNHRVIIICFTQQQVQVVSDLLTTNDLTNKKFYGKEKEINYDEDIIVATYSFAGKGFDYKELSCLILACPLAGKKSLIQVVGRILRSTEDKQKPLVIDLNDLTVRLTPSETEIKKKIIGDEFECDIIEEYYN